MLNTGQQNIPAALEGSSAVSGYSERYLFEKDIYIGKELHSWKSTVF